MNSALDLVFRPLDTTVQDAPNRRSAHPGSGEEFAGFLSKARDSRVEQAEIDAPAIAPAAAMVPPLPAETTPLALPTLSEDGHPPLPLVSSDRPAPTAPTRELHATSLPAAETLEREPAPDLIQPIKPDFELAFSETAGELVSKPEVSRPSPRETPDIKGDLEPVSPEVPTTVETAEASVAVPVATAPEVQKPFMSASPATPRASEPVAPAAVGVPTPESPPLTRTPRAGPARPSGEVAERAPASDGPDLTVNQTFAAPSSRNISAAELEAAAASDQPVIAAPAVMVSSPPLTRTPRAAPAPPSGEVAERAPASDGKDLAVNQTFAATPSLNIAATEVEASMVAERPVIAAPAVPASSPSIVPRTPAKPGILPATETPSSPTLAQMPGTFEVPEPVLTGETLVSGDTSSVSASSAPAIAAANAAPVTVQAASVSAPVPAVMAPANAILVAAPADVASIVSSAADNGEPDRIVIQLDPPELGRVSIDFKFDSNGLQHVTVTGETPDALRQLRLMHYELTQALERHGLGSQNMTFQQQHQNAQQSPAPNPFARQGLLSDAGASATLDPLIANTSQTSPRTMPGGRLDMKL